jgi:hypothetical protein
LASSGAFRDLLLQEFSYSLELTGADSPSQNGAVERYIMINLVFGLVLFCMVLAFLQNTVGPGDVLNYVTRVMKLTRGKLLAKTTGANGRPRNSYNLTNLTLRICLAHLRQWNPMKLCLISYGHTASRLLTPVRKLNVPATGLHVQDKYLQPA